MGHMFTTTRMNWAVELLEQFTKDTMKKLKKL